jgi:hypothetical protein
MPFAVCRAGKPFVMMASAMGDSAGRARIRRQIRHFRACERGESGTFLLIP